MVSACVCAQRERKESKRKERRAMRFPFLEKIGFGDFIPISFALKKKSHPSLTRTPHTHTHHTHTHTPHTHTHNTTHTHIPLAHSHSHTHTFTARMGQSQSTEHPYAKIAKGNLSLQYESYFKRYETCMCLCLYVFLAHVCVHDCTFVG